MMKKNSIPRTYFKRTEITRIRKTLHQMPTVMTLKKLVMMSRKKKKTTTSTREKFLRESYFRNECD